jgi:ATP-dependent exoDNAse (exonuclease V) beta subunit
VLLAGEAVLSGLEQEHERLGPAFWSGERSVRQRLAERLAEETISRPLERSEIASCFGTEAHQLIEETLRGRSPTIPPAYARLMSAFEALRAKHRLFIAPEDTERIVFSERYGYAGALDALGRLPNGQRVALDWKTSREMRPEYALQLAAYARAYEEMTGSGPVDQARAFRPSLCLSM